MGTQVICPRVASGCRFVGARGALELHLTRECEFGSPADQLLPAGAAAGAAAFGESDGALDAPSESLESDIPDSAGAIIRKSSNQPSTGLRRSSSQHRQHGAGGGAGVRSAAAMSAELSRKELSLSPRRAPSRAADAGRELIDGAMQPVYPAAFRPGTAFAPIQQSGSRPPPRDALADRRQQQSAFSARSAKLVHQQQQQTAAAFAMGQANGNGTGMAPMPMSFNSLECSRVFTSAMAAAGAATATATVPKLPSPMEIIHLSALAAGTTPSPPVGALQNACALELEAEGGDVAAAGLGAGAGALPDGEIIVLELARGCFDLGVSFVGGIDTPLVRRRAISRTSHSLPLPPPPCFIAEFNRIELN